MRSMTSLVRLMLTLATLISLLNLTSTARADTVSVGTIERPPFSFRNTDGELTGFSVELWKQIAQRLDADINWVEYKQFGELIDAASGGNIDVAIANISITSARESNADFSQPIYESGMAIGVRKGSRPGYLQLIWESGILWFLIGAAMLVLVVANLIWFFERGITDKRHDYFRDDYFGGVWDAFWWAFVIMTMGGFEKEVPHKIINRVLAIFWIIVSLFFISTLTAKITTALTVAELRTGIESYQDLAGKRVGVTNGSSHETFLASHGIPIIAYPTIIELYEALKSDKVEAIVADAPILSYYTTQAGADWMVIAGESFNAENYGILLPDESPLIEQVNNALLELREEGAYENLRQKYFGAR